MSNTPEMPSEGGSYVRTKSGQLKRTEEPTVQDIAPVPVDETTPEASQPGTSGKD